MLDVDRVELHLTGVRATLNQPEVLKLTQSTADIVRARADAEMPPSGVKAPHHKTIVGKTKHGIQEVSVYTNTEFAKAMQAKHDTLTKALTGG